MSKWLRRGFGHQQQTNAFTSSNDELNVNVFEGSAATTNSENHHQSNVNVHGNVHGNSHSTHHHNYHRSSRTNNDTSNSTSNTTSNTSINTNTNTTNTTRFPMTTSRSRSTNNEPPGVNASNGPTTTGPTTNNGAPTTTTTTTTVSSQRRASPKTSTRSSNRHHHHHHHSQNHQQPPPAPFGTSNNASSRSSSQPRAGSTTTTTTIHPPPPSSSSRGNSIVSNGASASSNNNANATSSSAFESTTSQQQQQQHHHQQQQPLDNTQNNNNNNTSFLRASTNNNANIRSITNDPSSSSQQHSQPQQHSSTNLTSSTSNQLSRRPAYLLHRDLVIGKGSYGQVCIASRGARDQTTSQRTSGKPKKFACKCVLLRNDPKYIAKLQEEVNVLRELRGHRNVIRLYDVFCVDNELFIITELGRGGDLFHLLTTHPKHGVTESYAAKTVSEMLSAVAFLHSRHICHRDLKLENWVLESGKDVWSPLKLIDFGLSTHYTPGHRLSRVVGSSYYVAPEVLKKSYTEKCDLWSLGVIVYMLLSGAPPFYGKNDDAIKASIVQGEYSFPHELFRDVSNEAMDFVSTLLSYNVEYRSTAHHALSHPWLASNLDREQLERCMDIVGENIPAGDQGVVTMIE
eukprot:CAMPEP_0195282166 /NCGR_PEP_ID=MMETSP0707-20130614/1163_1 /TAXON_ID=33640 /ORGANISM="Asterionellopsis glacialis, Strain CCMP134" /LENGTH=627 /DNA_ID=CAMNT_0040341119 /DNA_START=96 /DNA_END=1979 /DNA_ORIENTATION=-